MPRIRISSTKTVEHDSEQIFGMKELSYEVRMIEKQAASDGEGTQFDRVGFECSGEAMFDSVNAPNQALAGSGDLVLLGRVQGGATDQEITIKNVEFSATTGAIPGTDSTGMATFRCRFRASPGPSDLPQDMVTHAQAP